MTNICDDKLVEAVSQELSKIGLFVPVSELEKSAIKVYDALLQNPDENRFVLNSLNKDDTYYSFLASAVTVDLLSQTRLKKVTTSFELNSILCLLDGYLHQMHIIADTKQVKASDLFKEIIIKLPSDAQHIIMPVQNGQINANHTINQQTKTTESRLCNSCDKETGCGLTDDYNCNDTINMMVEYNRVCFGFRIDPAVFGFNGPLENCDVRAFEKFMHEGYRQFKAQSDVIFMEMYKEHDEINED